MICAHLYFYNKVSTLLPSSARHLYTHIDEKFPNTGYLKSFGGVKKFLVQEGLIREEDCKCILGKDPKSDSTVACDKVKVSYTFQVLCFFYSSVFFLCVVSLRLN